MATPATIVICAPGEGVAMPPCAEGEVMTTTTGYIEKQEPAEFNKEDATGIAITIIFTMLVLYWTGKGGALLISLFYSKR